MFLKNAEILLLQKQSIGNQCNGSFNLISLRNSSTRLKPQSIFEFSSIQRLTSELYLVVIFWWLTCRWKLIHWHWNASRNLKENWRKNDGVFFVVFEVYFWLFRVRLIGGVASFYERKTIWSMRLKNNLGESQKSAGILCTSFGSLIFGEFKSGEIKAQRHSGLN